MYLEVVVNFVSSSVKIINVLSYLVCNLENMHNLKLLISQWSYNSCIKEYFTCIHKYYNIGKLEEILCKVAENKYGLLILVKRSGNGIPLIAYGIQEHAHALILIYKIKTLSARYYDNISMISIQNI